MHLVIVPTPIGNLEDISFRAINVLKDVDFILCEDTRTTKNLLNHYNIINKCIPYHIRNEHTQLDNIISLILNSKKVALVSDAGTPSISDPGFLLIRKAIANNIKIECLPGATALIPALVNSGFPSDTFYFNGFIPHKKGKLASLKRMSALDTTSIFYESPHRIVKTLEMMLSFFEESRKISISREISKIHEETFRGTIKDAIEHFKQTVSKGEFVVCIEKDI